MKTIADLKKTMVLGRQIEMLMFDGKTPPDKLRGVREVVKTQTNGVYLAPFEGSDRKSFFNFPKSNELEIHTTKHFTIKDRNENGDVWCVREYLIKN